MLHFCSDCRVEHLFIFGNMKSTDLDKKRWGVLIASSLINLCIGSIYAWSVFAGPLAAKLTSLLGTTFTAADLAIVFTVANSIGPVTMIAGGFVTDRLGGPRAVILTGGIMFGAGILLTGFAGTLGQIILTYSLLAGFGLGMAYGCTINNTVKFFPDKRGLVGGIATATYGLSSVLIPPVANALNNSVGVSKSFIILGVAFLVIIIVCSFFIVKCPADYVPKGFVPKGAGPAGNASGKDKNWKQMLADPVFYIMIVMLVCGAFSGLMITSQASPMAQKITGMSVGMAATAVSVLALFNSAGRIVAGTLSDRFGRVTVLRGAFILEIIGLGLLFLTGEGSTILFMAAVSIIGVCFGALMGVYPGFTADQFGPRNNSVNYGIMFIGFAIAGYFGPTVCGKILGATGTYGTAFIVSAAIALVGIVLTMVYKKAVTK